MFLNGTGQEKILSSTADSLTGVAVDWVARNLYWSSEQSVTMSRLDGSSQRVIVWKDVQPLAIAVDPVRG